MLRLSKPVISFSQSLDDCIAGIAEYMPLREKVSSGKRVLLQVGETYFAAARAGTLIGIAPFQGAGTDVVLEDLTKDDLVKVYDQYFVPEGKVARRVYDAIMSAALDKCPYCGGIGKPRNLDHFLPKAYFPQYSVFPANLVPACRDCNMDGKGDDFAGSAEEQPIQPYMDASKFFDEQWIFAKYHADPAGSHGLFEYYVSTPGAWSEIEKKRAANHFESFGLAARYAIKAAEQLGTVIAQIGRMKKQGLSDEDVNFILLVPGVQQAPFVNHWQRGMYQALSGLMGINGGGGN